MMTQTDVEESLAGTSGPVPRVSVVIPAFRVTAYIVAALESVFAQTFTDYEVILINDGCPDTHRLEQELKPFRERLVYIRQENRGAGAARNAGILKARGEFIAFLDGDDQWLPAYLETQVAFLHSAQYDLVYCDAYLTGASQYEGLTFMGTTPSVGIADFESLLDQRCNVTLSGSLARRAAICEAGMFETEKVSGHDFVLWLRMAHRGFRIGYQKKLLIKYCVRLDSISGDSAQRIEREINVYSRIGKFVSLDDRHHEIIRNHTHRLKADLAVERGKSLLLQGEYRAARVSFQSANEYRRSIYLTAIVALIAFTPKLFTRIFRLLRKDEIHFIPSPSKDISSSTGNGKTEALN